MKRKLVLPLAVLALTSAISLSEVKAETSICDNTLKRICQETQVEMTVRNNYIAQVKKEIAAEAEVNAKPRIAEMEKKISKFRIITRGIQRFKIRNQEIMRAAKKRMNGIESIITNDQNIQKMKSYLYQSIDKSSFSEATKGDFKETIKSVVVGNFADFLEKMDLENNVLMQFMNNACGSDGMVENAFATVIQNQNYVLVCPGFLIALKQNSTDEERLNGILQALAHEMGHHIDNSKKGNAVYAPFLGCVAKNHAASFNKTKDDDKFCKTKDITPEKCLEKVTISHAGELVADQWGIQATLRRFEDLKSSFSDKEKMLTESWFKLCGTADEGIHPTGNLRMGTIMRNDPGIMEALSCDKTAPENQKSCTLSGEVDTDADSDSLFNVIHPII